MLLEGKKALIFGVANDMSNAWGIAQAFHEHGAVVGFSSVESLIDRRVRPLAQRLGSTFVEPCDVQDDDQIRAVFEKWGAEHGELESHCIGRQYDSIRRAECVPWSSVWNSGHKPAGCADDL